MDGSKSYLWAKLNNFWEKTPNKYYNHVDKKVKCLEIKMDFKF